MGLNADGYARSLFSLLPPGKAWTGKNLLALIRSFAAELARADKDASGMVDDIIPSSTSGYIEDWERVTGLPDPNFPPPASLAARRSAVVAQMNTAAGPTVAALEHIAYQAGFTIRITEPASTATGIDKFTIYVDVQGGLSTDDQNRLVAIIQKNKQAHIGVVYSFSDLRFKAGDRAGSRTVGGIYA